MWILLLWDVYKYAIETFCRILLWGRKRQWTLLFWGYITCLSQNSVIGTYREDLKKGLWFSGMHTSLCRILLWGRTRRLWEWKFAYFRYAKANTKARHGERYLPIGDWSLREEGRQICEVILMVVNQGFDHGALRAAERYPVKNAKDNIVFSEESWDFLLNLEW